ncbi:helix-turn-helix domain-containing protein [Myroides odoratimimus]|uniref:helix-turn-helix domain-containing protein n=1 Tax=Myroides odoratimimus TaxID=76832 RepID=UPI002575D8B4|nr:helix-turn-helix domain-containing protein [Myroides odoratimimus]MDM1499092.1 helix-turn-helix domain-containing protein [Myroides odoratimimus]
MAIELKITLSDEQLSKIAIHIVNSGLLDRLIEKKDVPLEEQFLSLREVSNLLGVTTTTLHSHIKSGLLKAQKVGKQWRVNRKALKEYANGE